MEYQLHRESIIEQNNLKQTLKWIGKNWFQIILLFFALHIFINKDVNIQVNFNDKNHPENISANESPKPVSLKSSLEPNPIKSSTATTFGSLTAAVTKNIEEKPKFNTKWKPSDFNNLTFVLYPEYADKKNVSPKIVEAKLENCRKYVERFAKLAISEMEKFGIPASITLAQGLLETDAGASSLATKSNNHFGIKCRSKCKGCTCRNYSDDDEYDMFRVFDSAWESYREHSILLGSSRYKHLKKLGTKDYKNWAKGIRKAGYATDKKYAEKLIQIIEIMDLYQFDR
jgi:flagellum-specific peptidoglycan hydrolase FlgJ